MTMTVRTPLTRPSEVRALLEQRNVHPNRRLGQNFLIDGNILDILMRTADVHDGDRVLEVGAGLGIVTRALLDKGAHVTAVEKDHRLVAWLRESLASERNLTLVEGDALVLAPELVSHEGLTKLVSNLPYNPGSRILMDMIVSDSRPETMTVTVQKEVSARLTASPGRKAFGLMGLWAQLHYEVREVKEVNPTCFWPRPAVQSAIVHFCRREKSILPSDLCPAFYAMTRYAFQHRRKQLVSLLAEAPEPFRREPTWTRSCLMEANVDANARPECLPIEAWRRLLIQEGKHGG